MIVQDSALVGETQTQSNNEADFTQPHIAGQRGMIRVIRVPMQLPGPEILKKLRAAMALAADYANACLVEWWIKKAWQVQKSPTTYVDYGSKLSSYARDAISDRVKSIIRRDGKLILKNEQSLSNFLRDSSLAIRADANHRGAKLQGDMIRIRPQSEWLDIAIYTKALKTDWYLRETLGQIEAGHYGLSRVAVVFRRGKLMFHLTYNRPLAAVAEQSNEATLLFNETGELWLKSCGQTLNLTGQIYRLRRMKTDFAGIQSRLRRTLGRSGNRQRLRRALLKRQTFDEWADGPIGQLAATVTDFCRKRQVGALHYSLPMDGLVPWNRIISRLRATAEEMNMSIIADEASDDLKHDWLRLAAMAKAQQDLLRLGPPYDIYATDSGVGTQDSMREKGGD